MKPTKENRKKFDIDLAYGTVREEKIAEMLTDKKIEVKSEKDMWQKTGNICIDMNHGASLQVLKLPKLTTGFITYV